MSDSKPTTSPSAGDGGSPANGGTAPCPDPCTSKVFAAQEVNENITEVISNAPAQYSAWNNTFSWPAHFTVQASRSPCSVTVTVKIKVTGTITAAQKSAWKSAIEGKWNRKAKLMCPDPSCAAACPGGYPIYVQLQYVASGEHYAVVANTPTAGATQTGTHGLGGTLSMKVWGVNDTTDVTHEFGHMLGNVEEYFTTNGVDYSDGGHKRGFRDPGGGIMNNPANNPLPKNYSLIAKAAGTAMGVTCTPQAR